MKKAMIVLAVILFGLFFAPSASAGDTGTYQIQAYDVVLTPHYNGEIDISYSQKWLVTGGHIPWVTVGTPNSNYDVKDFGGAAKSAKSANEGGWNGVRIDLDKDYQPQETFQFNFTIVQHRLLEKSGNGSYRLGYTPGWYDRAFIDALTIKLVSPAKISELKIDPPADSLNGQDIVWKRKLGKGEKFTISVGFPNGTYNRTAMEQSESGDVPFWIIVVIGGLVIVGILIALALADDSGDSYSGSSGYSSDLERRRRKKDDDDDDYHSPAIYAGGSKGSSSSSHDSGGGGGFGGRSSSCVCACVSCACACACAGGGGAGCSRKNKHFCSKCSPGKVMEDEKDK